MRVVQIYVDSYYRIIIQHTLTYWHCCP